MSTYLVTGGFGFIGSNIVDYLLQQGETVRVLDDMSTGKSENLAHVADRIAVFEGGLLDRPTVQRACDGADYVLHQAALASVQRSIDDPITTNRVNVEGSINLLDACREAGVKRVVYAASSSAYGNQAVAVTTENLVPAPLSPYAVSKLAAEHYLASYTECYGLETVALRYFNVFGPRQDPKSQYSAVIPLFITACLEGRRPVVYGDGLQSRDFTFVENNVRANVLAATAKSASGTVLNVACGQSFSLLDLLATINSVLGTKIEPVFEDARKGDVKFSVADISRAKAVLGYDVTVEFHEGMERTIDWYRRQMR